VKTLKVDLTHLYWTEYVRPAGEKNAAHRLPLKENPGKIAIRGVSDVFVQVRNRVRNFRLLLLIFRAEN
jgi:hypothetical protein